MALLGEALKSSVVANRKGIFQRLGAFTLEDPGSAC
jgi:hypothetical protein